MITIFKRRFFTFVVFLFLFSCIDNNKHATIKIMTFNIRYGTAQDYENSWQNRKDLVFEVIKSFNPDILGVQEALHFQLLELDCTLTNYHRVGVGRDDGEHTGEFTAIYFDSTRFLLLDEETFWFSDTPAVPGSKSWGNAIPRICTWVHLRNKKSKVELYVYNNHWDHQSQESRKKSAQFLIEKVRTRVDKTVPVVVMGDFNAAEDNPAFIYMIENDTVLLIDSYRRLYPQERNVGTFNGFEGRDDGPKIDAILISPCLNPVSAEIVRTNKNGKYPSDHFPVTAEVVLL